MPSSNFGCHHCILLGGMIQDLTAVVTGSHFLTFILNFLLASSYTFSSYTVFVISRAPSLFPPALLQTCISSSLHPVKLNRKSSFSFLKYDLLFIFLHPQQTLSWLKHPASRQVVYKSGRWLQCDLLHMKELLLFFFSNQSSQSQSPGKGNEPLSKHSQFNYHPVFPLSRKDRIFCT